MISTKTESHVRKFFNKYRKSLDLDKVCQESEANNAKKNIDEECIEVMEVVSASWTILKSYLIISFTDRLRRWH